MEEAGFSIRYLWCTRPACHDDSDDGCSPTWKNLCVSTLALTAAEFTANYS